MLFKKIKEIKSQSPLLSVYDKKYFFNDISNKIGNDQNKFLNCNVTIYHNSLFEATTTMLALDGIAKKIVLLSPQYSIEKVLMLAQKASSKIIVSDNPKLEINRKNGLLVFKSFNELNNYFKSKPKYVGDIKTEWILSTSGTTGTPKLVSHSFISLTKTTKIKSNNKNQKWGLLYDYTRYAGLQVVLQSFLSGSNLLAPDFEDSIKNKIYFFNKNECSHLSATPTMWRKILMVKGARSLKLNQITLGGEISDEKILTTLGKSFPKARVTNIFASTEAGVGFSVHDKKPGFPVDYLTNPPLGIGLKICKNILYIQNKNSKQKYIGTQSRYANTEGWVNTGDIVKIEKDRIIFKGRKSGIINVGGENVYPEEIESIMQKHKLITQARVYPIKSPIVGSLLCADIILSETKLSKLKVIQSVNKYLQNELDRFKIPSKYFIIDNLNINSGGKLERK